MKAELKKNEINKINDLANDIWFMSGELRGRIPSNDYALVLFILTAFKDNTLRKKEINECKNYKEFTYFVFESNYPIFKQFQSLVLNNESTVKLLLGSFENLNKDLLRKYFSEIFEILLFKIQKFQGKFSGYFSQSNELSRFIVNFANISAETKVYNPFSGIASYRIFLNTNQNYIGNEINLYSYELGILRLLANGTSIKGFLNEDVFQNWPENEKCDVILSTPPINLTNKDKDQNPIIIEKFLTENGDKILSENGKLILTLPISVLSKSGVYYEWRKNLIENKRIESIISFPGGLLNNTNISIVVIVITKTSNQNLKLIDGSEFVINYKSGNKTLNDVELLDSIRNQNLDQSFIKTIEETQIQNEDYNLSLPRYFQKSYSGVQVSEVLELIKNLNTVNETFSGKEVKSSYLSKNEIDFVLNIETLETKQLNAKKVREIKEDCLLITNKGLKLKPTLFFYSGESIFIERDILAFKINKSLINPHFLVLEINSNLFQEQVSNFRVGEIVPTIIVSDFLRTKINIPSLHEQEGLIKSGLSDVFEIQKKNIYELKELRDKESDDKFGELKHKVSTPILNVVHFSEEISKFLNSLDNNSLKFEFKTVDEKERLFENLAIVVSNSIEIQNYFLYYFNDSEETTNLSIFKFLKYFIAECRKESTISGINSFKTVFDFELLQNDGILDILVEVKGLKIIFNNLYENAIRHGFGDKQNKKNMIEIRAEINQTQNSVKIYFCNNGKPLPNDFSIDKFKRKGYTENRLKGSGIGGSLIYDTLLSFDGNIDFEDLSNNKEVPMNTCFVITIPIKTIKTINDEN